MKDKDSIKRCLYTIASSYHCRESVLAGCFNIKWCKFSILCICCFLNEFSCFQYNKQKLNSDKMIFNVNNSIILLLQGSIITAD
jgi:hypothetical protein